MTVEAIKTKRDIELIDNFLNKNYTKLSPLFKFGINTALRISDILTLKFEHIQGDKLNIKEIKTGKKRTVDLNTGALQAIERLKTIDNEAVYLFQSNGNRVTTVKPYNYSYVIRAFKEASYINGLSMPYKLGTHSMRKTFGYHQYTYNDVPLSRLMALFGHTSEAITLRYIGITSEDISNTYKSMVL